MDAVIYKISKEGVPQMVFAADSLPADADTNPNVNGRSGGQAEFFEIDSFADQNDVVAVGGSFRGVLPCCRESYTPVNPEHQGRKLLCARLIGYLCGLNLFLLGLDTASQLL